MYKIFWEKKALKRLKRIPIKDRRFINDSVKQLANWTDFHNVKSLINHQYQYRLRVERYRVFFDKEESLKILKIEEVKKRDERTY